MCNGKSNMPLNTPSKNGSNSRVFACLHIFLIHQPSSKKNESAKTQTMICNSASFTFLHNEILSNFSIYSKRCTFEPKHYARWKYKSKRKMSFAITVCNKHLFVGVIMYNNGIKHYFVTTWFDCF